MSLNPYATGMLSLLILAASSLVTALPAEASTSTSPTIASLSTTDGLTSGGETVTATGTNLTEVTKVLVGSVEATSVRVKDAGKLTFVTPQQSTAGSLRLQLVTSTGRTSTTGPVYSVRTYEQETLRLVNKARAKARKCGSKKYKAAPALKLNTRLNQAADRHAVDMAKRNYFSHYTKGKGWTPKTRMKKAGFTSSYTGENLSAGRLTPAAVVKALLKSKGHCQNIMNRKFRYLGVGHDYGKSSKYGHYWVQKFAR